MPAFFARWPFRVLAIGLRLTGAFALLIAGMLAVPLRQPPELESVTASVRRWT